VPGMVVVVDNMLLGCCGGKWINAGAWAVSTHAADDVRAMFSTLGEASAAEC